jgi:hypothetical protein
MMSHLRLLNKWVLTRVIQPFARENGSALVEFVVFAIPLFIPLVFFINTFAAQSFAEIAYQNIARQSLRAFVASSDFETGIRKIEYILDNSDLMPTPKYKISCPVAKCFTPGTVVSIELLGSVTVRTGIGGEAISGSEIVLAKVSERFDQWRED